MNLTTQEVADLLRCCPSTVHRIRRQGNLIGMKRDGCWLYSREAVDEYLRSITVGPPAPKKPRVRPFVGKYFAR